MAIEMVPYFRGKRLEDMTREELIDAVNHMGGEAERWRNAYFEEAKGRLDDFRRIRDQVHREDAMSESFEVLW